MNYKYNEYLVGIKEMKFYFKNKEKIDNQKKCARRRKICFKKNKDKYYLMRMRCKIILKKLNIY